MILHNPSKKKILYYLLGYLIIWVLLFEFILPVNDILPKPSIVFLSFGALWKDYHLPANALISISSIYAALILSYFLAREFSVFLIKERNSVSDFVNSLHWFSKYVPGILFGLFLIYWFPEGSYLGFVFVFITSLSSLIIKIQTEQKYIKQEYVDAAKSLGANNQTIAKKVLWPSIQPQLFNHILELHLYLWFVLIVFEFIKGGFGLGVIYSHALSYKDLSALFTVTVITGLIIFVGSLSIKYFKEKYYDWESL